MDRAVGQIDILTLAVPGGAVADEMILHRTIAAMLVGHHAGFAGDVLEHDRHERFGLYVINDHRAGLAGFAVNQRQNLHLVMEGALLLDALQLADESLVTSTMSPLPPKGARSPERMASRMR